MRSHGRDHDKHETLAVPAQRVLEQVGELKRERVLVGAIPWDGDGTYLGIAVRDVCAFLTASQRGNNIA